jgi:hypothetical protein
VNEGMLAAGIALLLIGAYHLVAGLEPRRRRARRAGRGHRAGGVPGGPRVGAARVAGPRQPPDLADPALLGREPAHARGSVLVDGVDGEIVAAFTEDNPEDWSDLDGALDAG